MSPHCQRLKLKTVNEALMQQVPITIDTHKPVCVNAGTASPGYSTSSGHGTMVDFTVFIAIASATACPMPASENG